MEYDLIITNGTVVLPDSGETPIDIGVKNGRIAALLERGADSGSAGRIVDATGSYVFPGLIDAHVHFGFAEPVTEYTTETVYAAQGGFSTVIGYFLNNEAYSDVFKREIDYALERCHVDFAFHFSTASELHVEELDSYVKDYGVTSFKYFMNFKSEEGRYLGLDGTDDGYLYALLEESARIGDVVVVLHTENIEIVNRIRRQIQAAGKDTLRDWSDAKPPFTESESVNRACYFANHHGAKIFIPHLSTRMALDDVRMWRERFEDVYVETCPHYLTFTQDADLGSLGKANPPFRSQNDVDALWEGLADGAIDIVASDHVPRKRATKETGLWQASQGFPGTATILPVLLHHGFHKGRLSLQRIAQLLTSNPADIFQLPMKGDIRAGLDADLTIVDVNLEKVVDPEALGSYSDYSLYEGQTLKGWPTMTIVRGTPVMDAGQIVGPGGYGQYIRRRGPALSD